MRERLEPEVFYGAAIVTLCGLLFGLALHVAWSKHPGGPQIVTPSAAAAEAAHPVADKAPADPPAPVELAQQDSGPVAPDPLPVTRLAPEMFDVQPAAADQVERQDADDLADDDAPQPQPSDLD